jgi:plasmid stability protein
MASLLIRNFDDALRDRLKARARTNHRSLEEEARETLRLAVARDAASTKSESLLAIATRIFGPERGVDLDLPPRDAGEGRPPVDFSGPEYDR